MMFKVISMHSKPCKHAKYNEILRNKLKQNEFFKTYGHISGPFVQIYS